MARNREEAEILGSIPEHGEDPRFADGEGVFVTSNGAFSEIEDFDHFAPVDVDETPYMSRVTDGDGYPGFRPYVDANTAFDEAAGIDVSQRDPKMPEDDFAADDDFTHRLHQHAEAATDAVGNEVSDLERLAKVDHARHKELMVKAKYVRINPESAYRAMLGNQQLMSTSNPRPVQVATWSADSDVETTAVTIQFLPVVTSIPRNPGFGYKPIRAFGVINFGTRGVYTAEVDIGMGTQLTLNASEVSLQVGLEAVVPGTLDSNIILAGMLSFLPCVRTSPLTRTLYVDQLAPGGFTTLNIPAFAKSLTVLRSDLTLPPFFIVLVDTAFQSGYPVNIPAGAQMAPIQLAGDLTRVFLQNTGAVPVDYHLIFNLGL